MAQPAPRELIAQRSQEEIGIRCVHDDGWMSGTVVLLHGFTHTGASWAPVVAALGERYRPLTPDIRGHGLAAERTPVDLAHVIADISALTPGRFTLAGYSMGGRISLHAALALGDRVERLVLIGASPGIADDADRAARNADDRRIADELQRSTIEVFAARWAQTPVLAGQPPEVLAAAYADRLRSTPAGLARALRGLGTGALPSLWERLDELKLPVSLLVGERDAKFRGLAERMGDQLDGARIEVVAGAGHAVHLEAPVQVAAMIAGG
jgi:2-succinyl-6-hydroxy-2,4-cyclohexadiene-1-carboxylate synthase